MIDGGRMGWVAAPIDETSVTSPLDAVSAPQNESKGSVGVERTAVVAGGLAFAQILISACLAAKDQGHVLACIRTAAHILSVLHPRKGSSVTATVDNNFWLAPRRSFVH
jgi:hypothetical protein